MNCPNYCELIEDKTSYYPYCVSHNLVEQAKKMEKELKQKRADLKVARAKQNMIKKQAQIRKVEITFFFWNNSPNK